MRGPTTAGKSWIPPSSNQAHLYGVRAWESALQTDGHLETHKPEAHRWEEGEMKVWSSENSQPGGFDVMACVVETKQSEAWR